MVHILMKIKGRTIEFSRHRRENLANFNSVEILWSGLRGSNPPPRPWQGRALPNELNPHRWCEAFLSSTLYIITHSHRIVNSFLKYFLFYFCFSTASKIRRYGGAIRQDSSAMINHFSVRISTILSIVSSVTPARRRNALACA